VRSCKKRQGVCNVTEIQRLKLELCRNCGFHRVNDLFVADAHRDDGKRFVAHADEKLTAFLELERVTRESLRFLNAVSTPNGNN